MGDMLLHETGVSWLRGRMRREKPEVVPWEETRAQRAARASRCVRQDNVEYDVAGLYRDFPARLLGCIEREHSGPGVIPYFKVLIRRTEP